MSEIVVRPGRPQDVPGIARVQVDTWRHAHPGLVAQAAIDAHDDRINAERIRRRLEDPAGCGWFLRVAEDGDRIFGDAGGGQPVARAICRRDDLAALAGKPRLQDAAR